MDQKKVIVAIAIATSDNLRQLESDSESEEDFIINVAIKQQMQRVRGELRKPVRNEDFLSITIPRLTDDQFRQHFRVTVRTFENLEFRLRNVLVNSAHEGRNRIPVRQQLLSVLWLLATPDSFRSVSDRFDMGKSILHDTFVKVVEALNGIADSVIIWPTGEKLISVKNKFQRLGKTAKLANVIGAIDGSHIPIPAPKVNSMYYKTRNKEYAVTLQAVCDADLLYTDCFAGFPGSVPDVRVFRNSDLWQKVRYDMARHFPDDEFIIGDKAYPVLSWCIPPFINRGNLTEDQKKFNNTVSEMRQVVERSFALLKGRFRRLKYLDMKRVDLIPFTILACCVLHNICILGKDENNEEIRIMIREGQQIRNAPEPVPREQELVQEVPEQAPDGVAKRNHLLNLVARQIRNNRN
ncbi:Protein ALP1-like [Frankliniella fusca]|uniref:Protein ALP1-like n=1 Tax=Frankliniella fusca TaxID=407009 RepID=A0AAE1LSU5_9NEOP|nr:Protein ALP1-like [Frankliniella fusca]